MTLRKINFSNDEIRRVFLNPRREFLISVLEDFEELYKKGRLEAEDKEVLEQQLVKLEYLG